MPSLRSLRAWFSPPPRRSSRNVAFYADGRLAIDCQSMPKKRHWFFDSYKYQVRTGTVPEYPDGHGIASYLLPLHSICYPSCRSILLPILPVCTLPYLSLRRERLEELVTAGFVDWSCCWDQSGE